MHHVHIIRVPSWAAFELHASLFVEWAALAALALFIVQYSVYDRRAWRNPVGSTLLWKDLLLCITLASLLVSQYLLINRPGLLNAARWFQISCVGLICPVVLWRSWVFRRIHMADHGPDALARAGQRARALLRRRSGR